MALAEDLEAVLALIPDESDRAAQRSLLEKHQVLRDGYLRQADYDRKFNQFKAEKSKLEETVKTEHQQYEEWKEWYDRNKPIHEQVVAQVEELTRERDALQAQIANAVDQGEGETVETAELIKQLAEAKKNISSLSTEAQKMAREEAKAEAAKMLEQERKKFWEEAVPATVLYQARLTTVQNKYSREFKDDLDVLAFDKFMKENNFNDPEKAYDAYLTPKRHESAIAAAREEGKKEGRDEVMKTIVPGSGASPAPEIGPLRAVLQKKTGLPDDASITPGGGMLSQLAADELRSEGKW